MKILLTGAGGFVGQHFMTYNKDRFTIVPFSLRDAGWEENFPWDIDVVVHSAGKAHEVEKIDEDIYFRINTELTKKLYEKAVSTGVKQFIYLSSTKVYGDHTDGVLDETSPCNPDDAYGKSKLEAENFLLSRDADCKIAIVRPPLVYGPGVKGNMISLLKLCARKILLPFNGIDNRRSMVYIDNLIELINTIIQKNATGVYIAGDAAPLSTEQLVTGIRRAMDRKPGLIRVPGFARSIIKKLRPALYIRLFGSYEVNPENGFKKLSFIPPHTTEYGIQQMVNWYSSQQKTK